MDKNKIPTHVIHKVRKLMDLNIVIGKAQLDEIATHLNLPTQAEIQEIIDEYTII